MSDPVYDRGLHVVLGGSLGIGYAYALWHAKRGANLLVIARNEASLDTARDSLLGAGAKSVRTFSADLTDPQALQLLWKRLEERELNSLFAGGPSPPAG